MKHFFLFALYIVMGLLLSCSNDSNKIDKLNQQLDKYFKSVSEYDYETEMNMYHDYQFLFQEPNINGNIKDLKEKLIAEDLNALKDFKNTNAPRRSQKNTEILSSMRIDNDTLFLIGYINGTFQEEPWSYTKQCLLAISNINSMDFSFIRFNVEASKQFEDFLKLKYNKDSISTLFSTLNNYEHFIEKITPIKENQSQNAIRDFKQYTKYILSGDIEVFNKYICPIVLTFEGMTNKNIETMLVAMSNALKEQGYIQINPLIRKIGDIIYYENDLILKFIYDIELIKEDSYIHYHMFPDSMGKGEAIAISKDNGENWQFLELDGEISTLALQKLYPTDVISKILKSI